MKAITKAAEQAGEAAQTVARIERLLRALVYLQAVELANVLSVSLTAQEMKNAEALLEQVRDRMGIEP
jgi:hypothetical protein